MTGPIITNPHPVSRTEFENVCSGFAHMHREILNMLAANVALLEELRGQLAQAGTELDPSKLHGQVVFALQRLRFVAEGGKADEFEAMMRKAARKADAQQNGTT